MCRRDSASAIVGSAPSSSSASTASLLPDCAARWRAVTPSPWSGPPKVARWFGSAPSSTSFRIESTRPFDGGPDQSGAAVGVGLDARAELDELRQHLDPVGLRGPDERLVEHLLRVVGGLPGGEAAVGAVEGAVGARRAASRRARRSAPAAPRPAATRRLPGSRPSSGTTSRWPQKSAAISGVPPSPRAERSSRPPASSISSRELRAGSSSRPGAASSSRSRCRGSGRRRARAAARTSSRSPAIPSRSLPFVPRAWIELGMRVEQLDEPRPCRASSTAR